MATSPRSMLLVGCLLLLIPALVGAHPSPLPDPDLEPEELAELEASCQLIYSSAQEMLTLHRACAMAHPSQILVDAESLLGLEGTISRVEQTLEYLDERIADPATDPTFGDGAVDVLRTTRDAQEQELRQLQGERDDLLSRVVEELRQPLGAVRVLWQAMHEGQRQLLEPLLAMPQSCDGAFLAQLSAVQATSVAALQEQEHGTGWPPELSDCLPAP